MKKICVDAGHNDSAKYGDTGASGNSLREQDITFAIAKKLGDLFYGKAEIFLTRPTLKTNIGTSVNSSINGRVKISNDNKCDLFVSIHCNAGGGTGTETLVYAKGGEAEKLAVIVNDKLVNGLKLTNRGVKQGNIGVLRLTNCPAILVETAFIDTESDALLLKNNQEDFARLIYEGICEHLGIEYKESAIPTPITTPQKTDYENALDYLVSNKVINSPNYWIENKDKLEYLDDLILNFAKHIGYISKTNVVNVIKESKYYVENDIHFLEIPVENFKIKYWDKPKKTTSKKNYFNLGYFARIKVNFNGKDVIFTVPVGNFCGDIIESETPSYVLEYLRENGSVQNGKVKINSKTPMSTLIVRNNGKCSIEKTMSLSDDVVFAVSGAPIIINGRDPSFKNEVLTEGWDTSIVRATLHGFITVKDNKIIYMGFETKTKDCFTSSEVYNKLKTYNFDTVLKMDGGGSTILNFNGKNVFIEEKENRIVNNLGEY